MIRQSLQEQAGEWNLKVYAGPKLEMLLYGTTGPTPGVNATLKPEFKTEDWKLYGGLEAYIGLTMELFKREPIVMFPN